MQHAIWLIARLRMRPGRLPRFADPTPPGHRPLFADPTPSAIRLIGPLRMRPGHRPLFADPTPSAIRLIEPLKTLPAIRLIELLRTLPAIQPSLQAPMRDVFMPVAMSSTPGLMWDFKSLMVSDDIAS